MAIASGGPKEEVLLKLRRANLHTLFQAITAGSEVERGKPFPDIYLLCAKRLGLEPRNCLAFEDTQYGLEAAKSAGLICYAVPGEFSVKQDFSKADKIINNLCEAMNDF